MILRFEPETKIYILASHRHESEAPRSAQFWWHGDRNCAYGPSKCLGCKHKAPLWVWFTPDEAKAAKLAAHANTPELKERLGSLKADQDDTRAASRATDAEIEIPVPDGLRLYPFQKAGVAYALKKRRCLIGDEMRLGKTLQAIGVVNCREEIKKVLVICPATVKINWMREAIKWLIRDFSVGIANAKHLPRESGLDFLIINYDVLHKYAAELKARAYDLVVIDECHYIKNPTARRSKMASAIAKAPEKWLLLLTGTPLPSRPIELLPLLKLIGGSVMTRIGTEGKYKFRYCGPNNNGHGWEFKGATNLPELQDILREECMVRRLRAQVLTELPAKQRQIVEVQAEGRALTVMREELENWERREERVNEFRSDMELAKAEGNEAKYKAAVARLNEAVSVAFAEMSRVRHATAVEKIPYAISHLEECIESSGKIVAFAHHHDVIDALEAHFKGRCVVVTGATSMVKRQEAIDKFKTDASCEFFFGNILAAGVGISLAAASHVVMVELDWVPANVSQAEDRVVDIAKADSILVQHLVFADSLDCKMAKMLVAKQEVIEKTLDRERPALSAETVTPIEEETPRRKRDEVDDAVLTGHQIETIHLGLKFLAARCDGATSYDGQGFNKIDSRIGKSLASVPWLSQGQAKLGLRIIGKYKRQLEGVRL
jgi:SWI/SNF-related matrix-associated actin-dependent regulator 1 of chromatin subfamily A